MATMPKATGRRSRKWLLWLLTVLLLTLGMTYLLGRTVERVRAAFENVPAIGKPLFGAPVWQMPWSKKGTDAADEPARSAPAQGADKPAAPAQGAGKQPAVTPGATPSGELETRIAEAAAIIAAAEAKEKDIKAREAALKLKEDGLAKEAGKLAAKQAEAEALTLQLQGQLRAEQDRVEVVRSMSRSAQAQFMNALTDDEVLAILKYLTADEVAKLLEKMDPYRAARLFQRLPLVAPAAP